MEVFTTKFLIFLKFMKLSPFFPGSSDVRNGRRIFGARALQGRDSFAETARQRRCKSREDPG